MRAGDASPAARGTADLVRTSSIMKGDVEVPKFTGSSFAGSSAPPGAAVRAGGPSYQQQEHQRFLEVGIERGCGCASGGLRL